MSARIVDNEQATPNHRNPGEGPQFALPDDNTETVPPVIGAVRGPVRSLLRPGVAYRTSSLSLDSVEVGRFAVCGASLVGSSHAAAGTVRQDAYDFAAMADGRVVLAIADGMGSRPYSQLGAAGFCSGVTIAATRQPEASPAELLRFGVEHCRHLAVEVYGLDVEAVAFVAAVAVVTNEGPDESSYEIARVGDVSAFTVGPAVTELFASDDSPVNLVSASLPGAGNEEIEVVTGNSWPLALVTDGLANDLRHSPGVRDWLAMRWARPESALSLGASLSYRRQGSHDDRTAVVVWSNRDREFS